MILRKVRIARYYQEKRGILEMDTDEEKLRELLYEIAYENISLELGKELYEFLEGKKDDKETD